MKGAVAVLLLGALLAGCADHPSKSASTTSDPVAQFDVEVQASKTTGVIRGVVVDAAVKPVVGANVSISPGDTAVRTTENGAFGFSDLEPGTYFLHIAKAGFNETQTSAEVVAGVDDPPFVKVLLQSNPGTTPYFDAFAYDAFISCGFAVVATSVGCDTYPPVGTAMGDRVYFDFNFDRLPSWTQGELVWKQTQAAGGDAIWEIVPQGSNTHIGYRETTSSPALAYIDDKTIDDNNKTILDTGITYRIFGGPHPSCTQAGFGCGVTLNQKFQVFVHNFYNFKPFDGWRFTVDGDPKVPQ